jgi:hypothetical protein
MIRMDPSRTFHEILERNVNKEVCLSLSSGDKIKVTIISVGLDCIQIDKIGRNYIPIRAIVMLTRPHVQANKD